MLRKAPGDDLRDAVGPHRHAVEDIRGLHRPLLVGDDDELRAVGVPAEELDEARDVRVVERCLDLVEEVEGARPGEEEREQERDRAERLLAAGEERETRDALAGRAQLDLDPRLRRPRSPARRGAAGLRRPGRASRRPPRSAPRPRRTSRRSGARRSPRAPRAAARAPRGFARGPRAASSGRSRRSFSASYSSRASGFTCPRVPRRDLEPLGARQRARHGRLPRPARSPPRTRVAAPRPRLSASIRAISTSAAVTAAPASSSSRRRFDLRGAERSQLLAELARPQRAGVDTGAERRLEPRRLAGARRRSPSRKRCRELDEPVERARVDRRPREASAHRAEGRLGEPAHARLPPPRLASLLATAASSAATSAASAARRAWSSSRTASAVSPTNQSSPRAGS